MAGRLSQGPSTRRALAPQEQPLRRYRGHSGKLEVTTFGRWPSTPVLRYGVPLFTSPREKQAMQGCVQVPKHQVTGIRSSWNTESQKPICMNEQLSQLGSHQDLAPVLPACTISRRSQPADHRGDAYTGTSLAHQLGPVACANQAVLQLCEVPVTCTTATHQ